MVSIIPKKRLAVIHPMHWEQTSGGAEIQINYLVEMALLHNFEVHFIYEDEGSKVTEREGLFLYRLKKFHFRGIGEQHALNSLNVFKLLKKINPDTVYTRMLSSWIGIAAYYAEKFNKRHILAVSSDNGIDGGFKLRHFLRPLDFFSYLSTSYALKKATSIVCQNDYQENLLWKNFRRRAVKISQSAPLNNIEIQKYNNEIKVLWVANFKKLKQPELFRDLALSFPKNVPVKFLMIGRLGKDYSEEEWNLPEANLSYLGELDNKEVNKWLCISHLLVNTSRFEGFSNTFVQAWLRKVPVISLNSNPDGILTNERIGVVCATFDNLLKNTRFLVENDQLRESMGEDAFNYACKNHSNEINLPKILNLLE